MKMSRKKELTYGLLLSLGLFLLFELFMVIINIPVRLDTWINRTDLEMLYKARHRFWYEYAQPSDIGFETRPNLDFLLCAPDFCLPVKTDKYGYRNLPGDPEDSTMVVLGDSFAFGYGVEFEESWPRILEAGANGMGDGRAPTRLANFATMAGAPWLYPAIMEKYAWAFAGRDVLLCLYANDFRRNRPEEEGDYYEVKRITLYEKPEPEFSDLVAMEKRTLFERTAIWSFIAILQAKLEGRLSFTRDENDVDEEWLEEDGWKELEADFARIHELAARGGSKLRVLLFPSRVSAFENKYLSIHGDTMAPDREEKAYAHAAAFFRQREVPVFDLTDPLRKRANGGEKLYFDMDQHWTNEGNKAVAEEVLMWLNSP
jgi:hypothetical protein